MLEAGCVMSSRLRQVLVLALLVGLATAASSTAQTQTQTPSRPVAAPPSLSVLTDQIVSLFPKIDGDVIEAQGTAVTLGLGKKDGVVAGIDMEIYREGRELRHPRTGASLGRTEQPVGRMQVQQVFEAYSTGTATQGTEVRPGDKARVSSGKIKLSLLSAVDVGVKPDIVEAVVQEVSDTLNRSGRFQVGMGDAMNVWLGQQGIGRQDLLDGKGLAPLAARFKVDNLLIIAFTRTQAKPYMDVRLFTFPGPTPLMTTALFVPPSIRTAPKGELLGVHQDAGQSDAQPAAVVSVPASHGRPRCRHLLEWRIGHPATRDRQVPVCRHVHGCRGVVEGQDPAHGGHRRRARFSLPDRRQHPRGRVDLQGGRAGPGVQRAARRADRRGHAPRRRQSLSRASVDPDHLLHPGLRPATASRR